MACPFSSMYGATKAFLTEFAASIAPEVRADGVDVTVVHPSPTNSNFYARKDTHALDALAFFKSTATGPERIARKALQCVGRQVVCDQGYYSIGLRGMLKILDVTFLGEMVARTAHTLGDYKKVVAERKAKRAAAKAK